MAAALIASVATTGLLVGTGTIAGSAPAGDGAATASTPATATAIPRTIDATTAVVDVAASASPAVVTITIETAGQPGFGRGSFGATGVGSGFIFDASGLILTNDHVIADGGTITVTFQDGTELPGTVLETDTVHDLAVVRVDATGLPTIKIGDASGLRVGQTRGRDRQSTRYLHRDRDERHPFGDGSIHRCRVGDEPTNGRDDRAAPDRCRHQ
jgi:S1-C subfamily serine protease